MMLLLSFLPGICLLLIRLYIAGSGAEGAGGRHDATRTGVTWFTARTFFLLLFFHGYLQFF